MSDTKVPPGWPSGVPPRGAAGFEAAATAWLLDQCPADYRGQGVWRRHPVALAWIASRHVQGQVEVMRAAYREARVDLGDHLPPGAGREVLDALEAEGLRLRAVARSAALLAEAMQGKAYVPRL